jgi:signal transduction histidine kinase
MALLYNLAPATLGSLMVGEAAAAGLGALVVTRRPTVRSGWLLISVGLTTAIGTTAWVVARNETLGATSYPLQLKLFLAAAELVWSLAVASFLLLLLTAPDGRFLSRRWRLCIPVLFAFICFWSAWAALNAFTNEDLSAYLGNQGTLGSGDVVESPLMELLGMSTVLTLVSLAGLSALALALRYRRSRGEERQQVKWVVFGCGLALVFQAGDAWHIETEPWSSIQTLFSIASYLSVTLGFGFALLRYRLWDIDLVIQRSLIYATLWIAIAGLYFGATLSLGLAASSRVPVWLAIGLTVLATVLFQPLRHRLEALADRWVFGPREQPLKVVQGFGQALGSVEQTGEITAQLAGAAIAISPLTWVFVEAVDSATVEVGRRRDEPSIDLPLTYGTEHLGVLSCQPMPGARLSEEDQASLIALATQAATAISRSRLASRLVRAQETERRRLERNIHDGAQQELVALVARLGLARSQNGSLDHSALLTELQAEVRAILSNLRSLAQGVHPSVLTDGGLATAVEDRCAHLTIPVTLEIAPPLRSQRFEEDVEAAAYYVVAEGLTNVLRHSAASAVRVNLQLEGASLMVVVGDDGNGFEPDRLPNGGGLQGLSDRLQAIGARFSVESSPGEGTTLRATLPARLLAPA